MKRTILLGFFALAVTVVAQARETGIFVGLQSSATSSDATHFKTVDNSDSANPTMFQGQVFRSTESANGNTAALGLILGWTSAYDSNFVSFLLEATAGTGNISGFLLGDGSSRGRNQYGEAWPEKYDISTKSDVGLIVNWGRNLQPQWLGIDAAYVLIGVKQIDQKLEVYYPAGCFMTTECEPFDFRDEEVDFSGKGQVFTVGGGIERQLSERLMGQLEIRFENTLDIEWDELYENGTLKVLRTLETRDVDVAIRVVWTP